MNAVMNTNDIEHVNGNQRQQCSCYGNTVDGLCYNDKCASSCVYCYATFNDITVQNNRQKHNPSSALFLGELKDLDEVGVTEFTRDDIVRNPLITKILDVWE